MVDYLYNAKILVVGDKSVGKTSFLDQIIKKKFKENCKSTVGIGVKYIGKELGEKLICLQFLDTPGNEKFREIIPLCCEDIKAAIIIYDQTNQSSFDNIIYWMKLIKKYSRINNENILLVSNKSDLTQKILIDPEFEELISSRNITSFRVSAKSGLGIEEILAFLVRRICS